MENKREVSALIPYKIEEGQVWVFLQKREEDTRILPGHFSFFGGKLEEGETPEKALEREIAEELCITVKDHEFLGKYNFTEWHGLAYVYFMKVEDNFENEITVTEGEYGKFLSEDEVFHEPMIIESDKNIFRDLYARIKNGKSE